MHHSQATKAPLLTEIDIDLDTELSYGRGNYIDRSLDRKTIILYTWKSPKDFHDPDRLGPPTQISLPRSQMVLVPYVVKGQYGPLLIRLDQFLAESFANLENDRSPRRRTTEPNVLIYVRCCLDFACLFIRDPLTNPSCKWNPPEATLPRCLETVLNNLGQSLWLGTNARVHQPATMATFHLTAFQMLEADERARVRRRAAVQPAMALPPPQTGITKPKKSISDNEGSVEVAVEVVSKRARTSVNGPGSSIERPIVVDDSPRKSAVSSSTGACGKRKRVSATDSYSTFSARLTLFLGSLSRKGSRVPACWGSRGMRVSILYLISLAASLMWLLTGKDPDGV